MAKQDIYAYQGALYTANGLLEHINRLDGCGEFMEGAAAGAGDLDELLADMADNLGVDTDNPSSYMSTQFPKLVELTVKGSEVISGFTEEGEVYVTL